MKTTDRTNWMLLGSWAIAAVALNGCGKASQRDADNAVGTLRNVRTSLESAQSGIADQKAFTAKTTATPQTAASPAPASAEQTSTGYSAGGGMHQTFKMDQADSPFQLEATTDVDGSGNGKLTLKFSATAQSLIEKLDLPTLQMTFSQGMTSGGLSIQGHSKTLGDVSIEDTATLDGSTKTENLVIKSSQGETDLQVVQAAEDKSPKETINGKDMTEDQKTAVKAEVDKIMQAIQGILQEVASSGSSS